MLLIKNYNIVFIILILNLIVIYLINAQDQLIDLQNRLLERQNQLLDRQKRFLTFPPTSPTRVQLIVGIGVPLNLHLESVTFGWVLKAEYFLPENASNYLDLLRDPLSPSMMLPINGAYFRSLSDNPQQQNDHESDNVNSVTNENILENNTSSEKDRIKRDTNIIIDDQEHGYDIDLREKYEKFNVSAVEIESKSNDYENADNDDDEYDDDNDDENMEHEDEEQFLTFQRKTIESPNLESSRWSVYKALELIMENKGFDGRPCVLRSICEAAHVPFSHSSGILGELLHIILTPSTSSDKILEHSDNEYLKAEVLGQSGAPCVKIFRECNFSVLDTFSGVYHMIGDLIKKIG